ncbi:MAG TPA: DUF2207 domain-containing protein, partial [Methanofastidiosum sp.]|nr:DUF2207 domain-containing protein [Methanofastidiosum sp.]
MGETKLISVLVIVTLLLGGVTLLLLPKGPISLGGDLVIENYEVNLLSDGTLTENYTFNVANSGQYRMLFRYWDDLLSFGPLDRPYIEFVNLDYPSGTTGYAKNYWGDVRVFGEQSHLYTIDSLAYNSEVGAYTPAYYNKGKYTLKMNYIMHPPIQYDEEVSHFNLKLLREHVPITKFTITLPKEYIVKVYPHPPNLKISETQNNFIITGSSAENELLEVELLLKPEYVNIIDGFPQKMSGVRRQTETANLLYSVPYYASRALNRLTSLLLIIVPFIFLYIYYRYGKEKSFTVPEFLSFVPNSNLKPWVVNLLFEGEADTFNMNAFYSTLLDLHRRNKIEIKEKANPKYITIKLKDTKDLDNFETKVINFIQRVGGDNGVVDTESIDSLAKSARTNVFNQSTMSNYQSSLNSISNVKETDRAIIKNYIVAGRTRPVPVLILGVILAIISVIMMFIPFTTNALSSLIASIVIVVQSIIALAFPTTLFGIWKNDTYKEKLEWDAFRKFLSDLALMKQYSPND